MMVLKGRGLCYLPMNSCRDIRLPIVGVGFIHGRQIKDEIPDLAVELVLVIYHALPPHPGIYTSASMRAMLVKYWEPLIVGLLLGSPTNCVS